MKKDIIITCISNNYNWGDIKNWIISIKRSGFSGDVLAFCYNYNSDDPVLKKLQSEYGVITIIPEYNAFATTEPFIWNSGHVTKQNSHLSICNVRHFHIWQYFEEVGTDKYDRVIHTDCRDLIFQTNPTEWLDENLNADILMGSEMILYKNQPWNINNSVNAFGPFIYEYALKNTFVCNAGSFAVKAAAVKDLCLIIYLMVCHTGFSDQSGINLLTKTLLSKNTQMVDFKDLWSLQVGAHEQTIDQHAYIKNGYIYENKSDKKFCLVHQYDRIQTWKAEIDKFYE